MKTIVTFLLLKLFANAQTPMYNENQLQFIHDGKTILGGVANIKYFEIYFATKKSGSDKIKYKFYMTDLTKEEEPNLTLFLTPKLEDFAEDLPKGEYWVSVRAIQYEEEEAMWNRDPQKIYWTREDAPAMDILSFKVKKKHYTFRDVVIEDVE